MEREEICKSIHSFLMEKKKVAGLQYDTELFKSKYITSLFALQIVLFIEKEFGIKLARKDISEKNFHTIDAMADLVCMRLTKGNER